MIIEIVRSTPSSSFTEESAVTRVWLRMQCSTLLVNLTHTHARTHTHTGESNCQFETSYYYFFLISVMQDIIRS